MKKNTYYRLNSEPDVIKGFSRTLAEIEWLLLALVLFYLVVGHVGDEMKPLLIMSSVVYACSVIFFHYLNFFKDAKQWKIAFQTWVMIFFITWVIWCTGKLESPLTSLYLFPIIASSITLGKSVTLLQIGLACAAIILLMQHIDNSGAWFSLAGSSELLILVFPMILVAYISTMLTADIQAGFSTLKIISETDELTRLFNHRSFKYLSQQLLNQSERHALNMSLLMIDTDNLKKVNDQFGHEAGNQLLISVAQCLSSVVGKEDIAARYGGDEFVILLPDCNQKNAVQIAQQIIEEFKAARLRYQGTTIELSASIGVACFPEHGHNIETLLGKADEAMYFSKSQGNCLVTLYKNDLSLAAVTV